MNAVSHFARGESRLPAGFDLAGSAVISFGNAFGPVPFAVERGDFLSLLECEMIIGCYVEQDVRTRTEALSTGRRRNCLE